MTEPTATDPRLYAPATMRNREPIRQVLAGVLPPTGLVFEVASGSGEHVLHFAAAFPHLTFQPSDQDPTARASIDAWVALAGTGNLRPSLELNVEQPVWPLTKADVVFCANMIHIAPWTAGQALIAGAARLLGPGQPLILYGPYRQGGQHTAPSNEAFDESLKARNPLWGVRDLEAVEAEAAPWFTLAETHVMPANNLTVVFRRT